jgi:hypothetical protein
LRSGLAQQDRDVGRVQLVGAAAVEVARAGGHDQVRVALEQPEVAGAERLQALAGGCAGAERRRA